LFVETMIFCSAMWLFPFVTGLQEMLCIEKLQVAFSCWQLWSSLYTFISNNS